MKAIVVYESLWGNTAAVARAIAVGIGGDARALSTSEATADVVTGADLIVAGAPLLGFSLPTDAMRESIRSNPANRTPDLSSPSMRSWLDSMPAGKGVGASFETRIWWSPGSAAKTIADGLDRAGYRSAGNIERFIVKGKYGPLRDGEIDKARHWGVGLAAKVV
ncbi:MAG: hypothetical protein WC971_09835 [Coriobacteriia bacterium]